MMGIVSLRKIYIFDLNLLLLSEKKKKQKEKYLLYYTNIFWLVQPR